VVSFKKKDGKTIVLCIEGRWINSHLSERSEAGRNKNLRTDSSDLPVAARENLGELDGEEFTPLQEARSLVLPDISSSRAGHIQAQKRNGGRLTNTTQCFFALEARKGNYAFEAGADGLRW